MSLKNIKANIIGIGIDIIEINRFEKSIKNEKFLKKIYSEDELLLLKSKNLQSYAGNFAVKEAFVKAIGTGFSKIKPNEIEVLREENNKPYIKKNKKINSLLRGLEGEFIHISISHDKRCATAICIVEKVD